MPCRERQTYQTPVRSIPRRRDAPLVARHDLSDPLRFGAQGRRRSRQASRGAFQIAAGVGDRGVFGGDASPRHGDNRLFGHGDGSRRHGPNMRLGSHVPHDLDNADGHPPVRELYRRVKV